MEILVSPGTIMPRICDECPQDTYCSALCTTLCADWCRADVGCAINDNGDISLYVLGNFYGKKTALCCLLFQYVNINIIDFI